jgi:hypothetical protein
MRARSGGDPDGVGAAASTTSGHVNEEVDELDGE